MSPLIVVGLLAAWLGLGTVLAFTFGALTRLRDNRH